MALSNNSVISLALLVTIIILKSGNCIEFSTPLLLESDEEHFLPHTRQKRDGHWTYLVDAMVNASDIETFEQILYSLNTTSVPIHLDNNTNISDINITTVCSSTSNGIQCRCEEQFAWPYSTCVTYGACDHISSGICKCINAVPAELQSCQPLSALLAQVEYEVDVELILKDAGVVDYLRRLLSNGSFFLALGPTVNVTNISITTVCYPNGSNFQCQCEDNYVWSYRNCITYGACDKITDDTCSCISRIPSNEQYCQPKTVVYEYLISIELNVSDAAVIYQLRTILSNISYPISINSHIQIYDIHISTDHFICPPTTPTTTTPNTTSPTTTTTTAHATVNSIIPTMMITTATTTRPPTRITTATTTVPTTTTTTATTTVPTSMTSAATTTVPTLTAIPTTVITEAATTVPPTTPIMTTTTILLKTNTIHTTTTAGIPTATTAGIPTATTTTFPATMITMSTTTIPPRGTTTGATTIPTITTTTTTSRITATSTLSTTTTTVILPTPAPVYGVEMTVTLNMTYTTELNNASSLEFKKLNSMIHPVLEKQYKGITGFINVFVKGFREGSVITDFVVQTTQVSVDEITEANNKLPEAMKPIAPVIGSVSTFYKSPTPIISPDLTYTGQNMTLRCGPPPDSINLGYISGSVWRAKGLEIRHGGRIDISNTRNESMLTINNVILADSGPYECILRGQGIDFLQEGVVRADQIKQAPIVRLRSEINIKCNEEQISLLTCCVQHPYTVQWFQSTTPLKSNSANNSEESCITQNYKPENCSGKTSFICRVVKPRGYEMTMTVTTFSDSVKCNDTQYGTGRKGDRSSSECKKGQEGSKTAVCQETGEWKLVRDTCITTKIKELLIESQSLGVKEVPHFVVDLSQAVQQDKAEIKHSSATISAVITMINTIANVSTAVNVTVMQDILETVDVIIGNDTRESWVVLNANKTHNSSSALLGSMETLSNELVGEFDIKTQWIVLNRTSFSNSFRADLNSVTINIPNTNITNAIITTITFFTLNNVMPARNSTFNTSLFNITTDVTDNGNTINAAVVLVKINATIQNVTLSYEKLNNSLTWSPQCVFWNFTLFDQLGAWDDTGCKFVSDINNNVTCTCNHITSFSLLMATDVPPPLREALDIITYIGVGISLGSLVICLIIEGCVWKVVTKNTTAFMRHVSIINTAVSLLIADICFIIGAFIAKNPLENPGEDYNVPVGPCSAATFFMHLFYLALFFWMLVSGLLLLYRTVMVFSHMSKATMLAISFSLGYGCPLIIAVITVAATAPGKGYIRKTEACWLNWAETMALLALVIPALTIVFINILIVIVVIYKMLRRGVGDVIHQEDEKHTLVVIARCVLILTPLFGLTWSLGVGTMVSSTNKGIHIAFALFNSLQGFFILVFGPLFDSKIRSILSRRRIPTSSTGSNPTKSALGVLFSFAEIKWINQLRGRRYVYHVSKPANSSSSDVSESFLSL